MSSEWTHVRANWTALNELLETATQKVSVELNVRLDHGPPKEILALTCVAGVLFLCCCVSYFCKLALLCWRIRQQRKDNDLAIATAEEAEENDDSDHEEMSSETRRCAAPGDSDEDDLVATKRV